MELGRVYLKLGRKQDALRELATSVQLDVEDINALPEAEEPELLEVECCLDTGSSVHAADRIDLPGYQVTESPGSRAGQKFQAAGGKFIDNEVQFQALMAPPRGPGRHLAPGALPDRQSNLATILSDEDDGGR